VVPSSVVLSVGEDSVIELESLSASGYRWQDVIDGAVDVVSITWRCSLRDDDGRKTAGESAAEIATIYAKRVGEVRVRLRQVRPWERDTEPLRSYLIVVRVRSD
jgi:predicted secreted protein